MEIDIFSTESFEKEKKQHDLAHYHNSIELVRVLNGCLYCLIEGKEYTVTKDCLCIINKNSIHKMYSDKKSNCNFQRIMIDPDLLISNRYIYNKYIEPILLNERFSKVVLPAKSIMAKEIIKFIDVISDLKKHKHEGYELDIMAFLHMILKKVYMVYKSTIGELSPPINNDSLLYHKMVDFIYENYSKKLSLDNIASEGNISRSKCCSIFKKYAQNSPINFLNLYRMEISTSLLKNTNESIASIAFACGFEQQSYYNRLFLREYGMTPKEYRRG